MGGKLKLSPQENEVYLKFRTSFVESGYGTNFGFTDFGLIHFDEPELNGQGIVFFTSRALRTALLCGFILVHNNGKNNSYVKLGDDNNSILCSDTIDFINPSKIIRPVVSLSFIDIGNYTMLFKDNIKSIQKDQL